MEGEPETDKSKKDTDQKKEEDATEDKKKQRTSERRKKRQEEKNRRREEERRRERRRKKKQRQKKEEAKRREEARDEGAEEAKKKEKRKKKKKRKKRREGTDKERTTAEESTPEKETRKEEIRGKPADEKPPPMMVAEVRCFNWQDSHCCTWIQHTAAEAVRCIRYRRNIVCPLVLLIILFFYALFGGIFMWIIERHITIWQYDDFEDVHLEMLWMDRTLPKDEWKVKAMKFFEDLQFRQIEKRWTIYNSIWYCFSVCTASKPAGIEPHTTGGKLFTVVYASVGIPLMIVVAEEYIFVILRSLRALFRYAYDSCGFLVCMFTGKTDKCTHYSPVNHEMVISLPFAIFMFVIYTFVGSQFLVGFPFSSLDAFYYSFLSFATISIDDPFYDSSRFLFFFLYIIFGIAFLDICLEGIGRKIRDKVNICNVLEEEEEEGKSREIYSSSPSPYQSTTSESE